MSAEFDVKMTRSMMFRFLMYHAYHSFAGWFGIAAGLALIGFYLWNGGGQNNVWYLAFGILFLVYQPLSMYVRAAELVKLSPAYRLPLHYALSEDGIEVRQVRQQESMNMEADAEGIAAPEPTTAGWDSVARVREDKKCLFVYTGKKNACIWPKEQLGAQEKEVRGILEKYVPAQKRKLK